MPKGLKGSTSHADAPGLHEVPAWAYQALQGDRGSVHGRPVATPGTRAIVDSATSRATGPGIGECATSGLLWDNRDIARVLLVADLEEGDAQWLAPTQSVSPSSFQGTAAETPGKGDQQGRPIMAKVPAHPRLDDHNARVLRLARDYDKKFRPVVIPLGKRMNLETGDSFPRVQLIMRDSARYTDNRKPLSRSQVFKLMAEMAGAGALKTEPRFGPTGRQRSSIRYLDVHVAIRFGQPVEHLWDAPLPGDETPDETPGETPDETPITLSISPINSLPDSDVRERGQDHPGGERGRDENMTDDAGICNTYIFWRIKGKAGAKVPARTSRKAVVLGEISAQSHARARAAVREWAVFPADRPPAYAPPGHAQTVTLTRAEASFMWTYFRKDDWDGKAGFLANPGLRKMLMDRHDSAEDRADRSDRAARKEAYERERDVQRAAERAERAPLVVRYCELTGQVPEDVEQKPIMREHRLAVAWLNQKIAEYKEQKAS